MMDRTKLPLADKPASHRTVAIVGASGYIGRNLVEELRRTGGYKIKLLVRSPDHANVENARDQSVEIVKGDLLEPESLRDFFEQDCTVINLVYLWGAGEAVNLRVTENLIEACKESKVKRLIHCSTAAVVGRVADDLINEATPCHPVTEYGLTKLKIEQAIISAGKGYFDVAILRPTSVFGPGGDPVKKLAEDLATGGRFRNYLKSCLFGERRMNLVPVANVTGAIVFLMSCKEDLDGEVFIVSNDDSPINNFAAVEKFLMREFRTKEYLVPRVPLPLGLLAFLLRMMGRNNVNPRCNFKPDKLLALGFRPVVTFEEALAEYASWYRTSQSG